MVRPASRRPPSSLASLVHRGASPRHPSRAVAPPVPVGIASLAARAGLARLWRAASPSRPRASRQASVRRAPPPSGRARRAARRPSCASVAARMPPTRCRGLRFAPPVAASRTIYARFHPSPNPPATAVYTGLVYLHRQSHWPRPDLRRPLFRHSRRPDNLRRRLPAQRRREPPRRSRRRRQTQRLLQNLTSPSASALRFQLSALNFPSPSFRPPSPVFRSHAPDAYQLAVPGSGWDGAENSGGSPTNPNKSSTMKDQHG